MNTTWKIVRVFISSTFRDMQAERDQLVRFVLPRLREQMLPRRIHLEDVDLRWGVTSEQDASEVCREIVDECRPRFLCMLGGRYGWVPPGKTLSITADEVHYGVLDRTPKDRGFAYFYFRDDAATAGMVESTPGEFREPGGSDNQNKLAELKQAIIDAGLNPFTYPAQWDNESRRLVGLKKFGDRVYDNLLRSIDAEFGTATTELLDEFAGENAAMEAFVEECTKRFVLGSRETVREELLVHTGETGGNGYVCLTGAPGSGKSALLAHISQHAALNDKHSTFLIRHFIGASPGSTDVRRTLRRLCHELKVAYPEIIADIPDDLEKLRVAFLEFLRHACARKRLVILLDAINHFDPPSHTTGIHWLPEELPANARIVLSALDGPALEELRQRQRKPREIELKPLTVADGEAIIEQFLKRYSKQFEPDQYAELLAKTDAGMPLYLLAALEELRTLGTYEEISRRIGELPPTTNELFAWILDRLKNDHGFRDAAGQRVGRKLVPGFAAMLSASRHGLSQHELTDLLALGNPKAGSPIESDPQGNIAALLHLLRPYLLRRGELIDFYHGQFRTAAKKRWLKTDAQRHVAHQALCDHFRNVADPSNQCTWNGHSVRALSELPFHLCEGADQKGLQATLADLSFVAATCEAELVDELIAAYAHPFAAEVARSLPILQSFGDLTRNHAWALRRVPASVSSLAWEAGLLDGNAVLRQLQRHFKRDVALLWTRTSNEGGPNHTTFTHHEEAVWAVCAVDSFVYSGGDDCTVRCWQMDDAVERWSSRAHGASISAVTTSACGRWLASTDMHGGVAVANLRTGARWFRSGIGHGKWGVAISAEAGAVAVGGFYGFVDVLDLCTGQPLSDTRLIWPSGITGLGFADQGETLVIASRDGQLRQWRWRGPGKRLMTRARRLDRNFSSITSMALCPQGERAYCALETGEIAVFKLQAEKSYFHIFSSNSTYSMPMAKEVRRVRLTERRINCIDASPIGDLIAAGTMSGYVVVTSATTLDQCEVLRPLSAPVRDLALDGQSNCLIASDAACVIVARLGQSQSHTPTMGSASTPETHESPSLSWPRQERSTRLLRQLEGATVALRARHRAIGVTESHVISEKREQSLLSQNGEPLSISPCGSAALYWDSGPVVVDLDKGAELFDRRGRTNRFLVRGPAVLTSGPDYLVIANRSSRWDNRGFAHCIALQDSDRLDTSLHCDPGAWTSAVACSISHSIVALGGEKGMVRVYRLDKGTECEPDPFASHRFHAGIASLWLSASGDRLAVALDNGCIYSAETSNLSRTQKVHTRHSRVASFVSDQHDRVVFAIGRLGDVSWYDVESWKLRGELMVCQRFNWTWLTEDGCLVFGGASGCACYVIVGERAGVVSGEDLTLLDPEVSG